MGQCPIQGLSKAMDNISHTMKKSRVAQERGSVRLFTAHQESQISVVLVYLYHFCLKVILISPVRYHAQTHFTGNDTNLCFHQPLH